MRDIIYVVSLLAVVGLLEGLFYLRRYFGDRGVEDMARRIRRLGDEEPVASVSLLRPDRLSNIRLLDDLLRGLVFSTKLEQLLEQADVNMTVARFLGVMIGTGLGGLSLALLGHLPIPLQLALAALGAVTPIGWILVLRARRSAQISEQLPDALDMLSRALRAGYAINGACHLVATEMPAPINVEFGKAYEEQRLGIDLDKALVRMTQRVPSNGDLRIFAVSVTVQRETGGNLAELLGQNAATIRSRYRFYGKLRGLTAEGRISGLLLSLLPALMALYFGITRPSYLQVLAETPTGNAMLVFALVAWAVGIAWMYRMTKVEL